MALVVVPDELADALGARVVERCAGVVVGAVQICRALQRHLARRARPVEMSGVVRGAVLGVEHQAAERPKEGVELVDARAALAPEYQQQVSPQCQRDEANG